jgi:hypothetical protein
MEDKDIVGKEFTVFEFERFNYINWERSLDVYIGTTGKVMNLHHEHPEYANVALNSKAGVRYKHFPTHLIRKQLEELEDKSIDQIIIEMKQLILQIR